jgi:hypothetical protein
VKTRHGFYLHLLGFTLVKIHLSKIFARANTDEVLTSFYFIAKKKKMKKIANQLTQ